MVHALTGGQGATHIGRFRGHFFYVSGPGHGGGFHELINHVAEIYQAQRYGRRKYSLGKGEAQAGDEHHHGFQLQGIPLSPQVDEPSEPRFEEDVEKANHKEQRRDGGDRLFKGVDEKPGDKGNGDLLPGSVNNGQGVVQFKFLADDEFGSGNGLASGTTFIQNKEQDSGPNHGKTR